jgi:hypothetical protein
VSIESDSSLKAVQTLRGNKDEIVVRVQLPNPTSKFASQQVLHASSNLQKPLPKALPEVNQADFTVFCKMITACKVKVMPFAGSAQNSSITKISLSWPGLPE